MMRQLLSKLVSRPKVPTEAPDGPAAGDIYRFHTVPYTVFSPPDTGRYGAFKILWLDETLVVIAVLDGAWTTPPSERDLRGAGVLRRHRFAHKGRPAVYGVDREAWSLKVLDHAAFVGFQPLSDDESKLAAAYATRDVGISYSVLATVAIDAEGEWRWAHDREQLMAEHSQEQAQKAAERAAREARYRDRLKGLSFDQLLSETPLAHWSPSPPFPSETFTQAARARLHQTCREIQALGSKPGKIAARTALKHCVEWLNAADEKAGGVIETGEREDLCAVLEEIAFAAKQPALAEEVHLWRDW